MCLALQKVIIFPTLCSEFEVLYELLSNVVIPFSIVSGFFFLNFVTLGFHPVYFFGNSFWVKRDIRTWGTVIFNHLFTSTLLLVYEYLVVGIFEYFDVFFPIQVVIDAPGLVLGVSVNELTCRVFTWARFFSLDRFFFFVHAFPKLCIN